MVHDDARYRPPPGERGGPAPPARPQWVFLWVPIAGCGGLLSFLFFAFVGLGLLSGTGRGPSATPASCGDVERMHAAHVGGKAAIVYVDLWKR